MSPAYLNDAYASVRYIYSNGGFSYYLDVNGNYGVRPVLSLKSDITVTGSGTQTDPWIAQN